MGSVMKSIHLIEKLQKEELANIIPEFDGLIAGTEQIDKSVLAGAKT